MSSGSTRKLSRQYKNKLPLQKTPGRIFDGGFSIIGISRNFTASKQKRNIMSWFSDNILDISKKQETPGTKQVTPVTSNTPTPVNNNNNLISSGSTTTVVRGTVDQKFVDNFEDVFKKANIPGPDFYEFLQMFNNMKDLGLPEDKLYGAAFKAFKATAGADQRTLSQLIGTIDHYIEACEKDSQSFSGQVDAKKQTVIDGIKKKKDDNAAAIAGWQQDIRNLQQKIEEAQSQQGEFTTQLMTEENKLGVNIANYNATKDAVIQDLRNHAEKMKLYIKEV